MPYNFVPEDVELYSFRCNHHVLVQKEFIKYVRGFSHVTEEKYVPPELQQPHPRVNAYYEFAEDYDAVNRVPHLLHELDPVDSSADPSTVTLEDLSSLSSAPTQLLPKRPPEKMDEFVERKAQIAYLSTKPKCFVILGKPGLGEERLGKLLADYWRCVLISPETLVQEEIHSGSRAGLCIEFNLRCGRAISVDVIIRLLEKRLLSESVKHRGFVLCGFPLIANDLYEEDPISSESAIFNVQEIFEEMLEAVMSPDTVKHVSRTSIADEFYMAEDGMGSSEEGEEETPNRKKVMALNNAALSLQSGDDAIICYKSRNFDQSANQIEFVLSLCEDHDYLIIYLKCANDEVVNIRQDNRHDCETLQQVNIQRERSENIHYSVYDGAGNFPWAGDAGSNRLLRMQRDFPGHVRVQLDRYFLQTQLVIEKYILLKNPEDIIRLDGRMPPHQLLQVLRMRLKVLPFAPAILPKMLLTPNVEFDDPGEYSGSPKVSSAYDGVANEDIYLVLRSRKALGPLYMWNLSDWKYSCPVAMKEGLADPGLGQFAVHFMNSIFFLSSAKRCERFMENPRPYLLPPMPITTRRVFVIGPPRSGKTAVAKCVQNFCGAELIDFRDIKAKCRKRTLTSSLDREFAIRKSVDLMKEMRKRSYMEAERQRLKRVRMYIDCIRKNLLELKQCFETIAEFWEMEFSPFPTLTEREKPPFVLSAEKTIEKYSKLCEFFQIYTAADCQKYLDDELLIIARLPPELQEPLVFTFDVVGPNSSWVLENAEKILLQRSLQLSGDLNSIEGLAECINTTLADYNKLVKQGKVGGWILDGFPASGEILKLIDKECMPEVIYVIGDSTGGEALTKMREEVLRLDDALLADLFQNTGVTVVDHSHTDDNAYALYDNTGNSDEDLIVADTYLSEELPDCVSAFQELQLKYEMVTLGEQPFKEVLVTLIDSLKRWLSHDARIVTPEEKLHEPTYYGDYGDILPEDLGAEDEDDRAENENSFRENRRLGNTADYDPVAFANGVLWKGKEDYLVNYLNKMWLFGTETNMRDFISSPQHYDDHILFNKAIPPWRICIVGNKKVGKTTQARLLCKWLGLYYFDFDEKLRQSGGAADENSEVLSEEGSSSELLRGIIFPFWHDPNKMAIGFVMNGFPRSSNDLKFMLDNYLIPDCIVELHMEPHDLGVRLGEKLLEEWRNQITGEKEYERQNHETALEEWQIRRDAERARLLEERRYQKYAMRNYAEDGDRSENESLMSYHSFPEAQVELEVEAILQKQLPPPVLYDNWETEDQANLRIQQAVEEATKSDPSVLNELREYAERERIPWHSVNANMEEIRVYNAMMQFIMPYLGRNRSFFERAYDISIEMAERLLENGYYFLSRFGKTCPVQMFENYNPLQMYVTKEAHFQLFPVIYTNYIYFLAGADNRVKFKQDVLKYVLQSFRQLPLVRARVAVIGPPHSGKTTVAERMAYEYSLEHISVGKAVRRVLKYMPNSMLAKRVRSCIDVGDEVPVDLAVCCVEAMTFEARAVALGYVMDGFPNSIDEYRLLAQLNLLPHLTVDLSTTLDYIFKYMDIFDPLYKPQFSKKFIKYRFDDWLADKDTMRQWLDKEYQNLATVSVVPGRWKTWCGVRDSVLAVLSEIKHYYSHCSKDMALRVANMLVTPYEFLSRQSVFKNYCPLCLYYENALTYGGNPPDRTGLVAYHGTFYWLCGDHINEFIDAPDKFLGSNIRHTLPCQLPQVVELNEIPENVYLKGYCATCVAHSMPDTVLNMGVMSYALNFGEKIFMFDTEACMTSFQKKPRMSATLPSELPGNVFPPCDIESLPTLGMLEQYVGNQVVKALIEVEKERPFIPGLSVTQSAVVCLGLILKINNPNTPPKYLEQFKRTKMRTMDFQAELKRMIEELKLTINPYLHYQEPYPPFTFDMSPFHKESTDSMYIRDILNSMLDKVVLSE